MTNIFEKYKEMNLRILESIKQGKENMELFEARGKLINDIISLDIEKSQIKMKYEELGLDKLDKEIGQSLKDKMDSVKTEIKKIKIAKEASRGYASIQRKKSIFSQKI